MRAIFLLFSISLSLNLLAQDQKSADLQKPYDCEWITANAIGKLVNSLSVNDQGGFDRELDSWINQCGVSECTQRLLVLKDILENNHSEKSIGDYFRKGFEAVFRDRVESSQEIDYGYIYTRNKNYFCYVPLNHPLDSIVLQRSLDLLNDSTLTPDERLICTMFTGDFKSFFEKIDQREYKKSFIHGYVKHDTREDSKSRGAITIYSGIYRPIGTRRIFATGPMIGIALSSPLDNKWVGELSLKFRINLGDKDFDYYFDNEKNTVNSDMSFVFGLTFGYKLLESKNMILLPKLGIGLEVVDTGLYDNSENSNQSDTHNVTTMNLSLGVTTLIPVFKNKYIGLGINYHYCPYQWDTNLRTKFDTSAFSTELSWRF
jgi:hypothetical protein